MPLTSKGETIKAKLTEEYGAKKGEQVLYAGKNAGTFTGIDALADAVTAMCDSVKNLQARVDAYCDDHRVTGGVQIPPTDAQIRNELGLRFDKAHGVR